MLIITRIFGPQFNQYERDVFGRANNTGHGGCWVNDSACGVSDCIMADVERDPVAVDVTGKTWK